MAYHGDEKGAPPPPRPVALSSAAAAQQRGAELEAAEQARAARAATKRRLAADAEGEEAQAAEGAELAEGPRRKAARREAAAEAEAKARAADRDLLLRRTLWGYNTRPLINSFANECPVATRDGERCARGFRFVRTDAHNRQWALDCTRTCIARCATWMAEVLKNGPPDVVMLHGVPYDGTLPVLNMQIIKMPRFVFDTVFHYESQRSPGAGATTWTVTTGTEYQKPIATDELLGELCRILRTDGLSLEVRLTVLFPQALPAAAARAHSWSWKDEFFRRDWKTGRMERVGQFLRPKEQWHWQRNPNGVNHQMRTPDLHLKQVLITTIPGLAADTPTEREFRLPAPALPAAAAAAAPAAPVAAPVAAATSLRAAARPVQGGRYRGWPYA